MKTVVPQKKQVDQKWILIDAEGQVLGRLASRVAVLLRGKHKPEFTPHLDLGDHVVVVNAEKIRISGRKLEQKRYVRYTGYPGGLRSNPLSTTLLNHPEQVLFHSVKGMLPKNRLGRKMLKKLRIYAGPDHPHQAQMPDPSSNNLRKQ